MFAARNPVLNSSGLGIDWVHSCDEKPLRGSVFASAAWLASASWLTRSFATACRLSATCRLAAIVVMLLEDLREQTFQTALGAGTRIAALVDNFASANWLARSFATASWLSATCRLSTTSRLTAVAAVLVEQTMKEALLLGSASRLATASRLTTASWLARSFAATGRLARGFAATCWLYVTTSVTTLVTQFVKQAERASVG